MPDPLNPIGGHAFGDQPFGPVPEEGSPTEFGVVGTPPACRILGVAVLSRSVTPLAIGSVTPFALNRGVEVVC